MLEGSPVPPLRDGVGRPEFAWFHREIAQGVWIRASKAALWVRQADVEKRREHGCSRGLALAAAIKRISPSRATCGSICQVKVSLLRQQNGLRD